MTTLTTAIQQALADLEKGDTLCKINAAHILRQALASAPVALPEPDAVLRFERSTAGKENEMPSVVSCNWLPDGEYKLYTEQQVRAMLAAAPKPPAHEPLRKRECLHQIQEPHHFRGATKMVRAHGITGEPQ